jgi:hypothetical protein
LSLSLFFWGLLAASVISFWWHGDQVKSIGMAHVSRHLKQQNLQLLDQATVLKGVWPVRDERGSLVLRRRYMFEFSSTGESRYKGKMELHGNRLKSIELEPHIIPDQGETLH